MKVYQKKKVVCFGGGTGMPSLLSGLKQNPWLEITAIVNMFDTGGSSGVLKDQFGILPPGDVLKCLLSLSDDEEVARKLLLRRINNSQSSIHTGGNILLLGMEKVFNDYYSAVQGLGQLLNITGEVLPVTTTDSSLKAKFQGGAVHKGETSIDLAVHEGLVVEKLSLFPRVSANQDAIKAIKSADVICIGPGSFYTSVLPNFLPSGIKSAIAHSNAKVILIANLLSEGWGMKDFGIQNIVETVESYIGTSVDKIVANTKLPDNNTLDRYKDERKTPIALNSNSSITRRMITADLWTDPKIARHNQARLGYLISSVIQ